MKNLKSIALGLIVSAMAISFSAFTNVKAAGDQYGDKASGFVKLNNPYNTMLCQNVGANPVCGYTVTAAGASNVTGNFTTSQATTYAANGWITPIDSKRGTYSGN